MGGMSPGAGRETHHPLGLLNYYEELQSPEIMNIA